MSVWSLVVLGGQGQQTGEVRASFRAVDCGKVWVRGCAPGGDPCPALGKSGHRIEFLALDRKGQTLKLDGESVIWRRGQHDPINSPYVGVSGCILVNRVRCEKQGHVGEKW